MLRSIDAVLLEHPLEEKQVTDGECLILICRVRLASRASESSEDRAWRVFAIGSRSSPNAAVDPWRSRARYSIASVNPLEGRILEGTHGGEISFSFSDNRHAAETFCIVVLIIR